MAVLINVSKDTFVQLWPDYDIETNFIHILKIETNCKIKRALVFLLLIAF
jgi:hypothetical protein